MSSRVNDETAHHAPGADAASPRDIPSPGWKRILKRTIAELKNDSVGLMSAGVAFYAMLSLFPALAAMVMIYGLVADPQQVSQNISEFLGALPESGRELIQKRLTEITRRSQGELGFGVVVTLATALWSASSGMKGLISGINTAYDEREHRSFFPLRGLALALTLGAIVAAIITLTLIAILPAVLGAVGLGALEPVLDIGRWPLLALIVIAGLAYLYKIAPDRDDAKFRWVTPGSVVATILWLIGSALFSLYVSNFGNYDETYGSLAAVIILMLWFFLTGFIILFGAELNAETERQTFLDTTEGSPDPPGRRGADAADDTPPNPIPN